jgi:hypothetical protein
MGDFVEWEVQELPVPTAALNCPKCKGYARLVSIVLDVRRVSGVAYINAMNVLSLSGRRTKHKSLVKLGSRLQLPRHLSSCRQRYGRLFA